MSEKKYIDADALISECEEEIVDYDEDLRKHFIVKAVPTEYIEAFPAVDVEEVRHGKWVLVKPRRNGRNATYKCTVCNQLYSSYYNDVQEWTHCPCGAKMDGENSVRKVDCSITEDEYNKGLNDLRNGMAEAAKSRLKKPIEDKGNRITDFKCPRCKSMIAYKVDENFMLSTLLGNHICRYCGQEIDWSEVKEE